MIWEISRYMTKGQVPVAGPIALPDTLDTDITKSPRNILHTGHGCVQHLAEVASHTGISYCNERRAHLPHMSLVLNSSPLLGTKSVTVGNSTTAPGTLGNYQPLALGLISWVRY